MTGKLFTVLSKYSTQMWKAFGPEKNKTPKPKKAKRKTVVEKIHKHFCCKCREELKEGAYR